MTYIMLAFLGAIFSMALFFLGLRAACRKTLRRQFDEDYSLFVAAMNSLESLAAPKRLEGLAQPDDSLRLRSTMGRDFRTLKNLLKCPANPGQGRWREEWLLILYFRWIYFLLACRHRLRLREESVLLELTAILRYLANLAGERTSKFRVTNPAFSDFLHCAADGCQRVSALAAPSPAPRAPSAPDYTPDMGIPLALEEGEILALAWPIQEAVAAGRRGSVERFVG